MRSSRLAKHFMLRESRSKQKVSPRTRRLAGSRNTVGHVFVRLDGTIEGIPPPERSIVVTTDDGVPHEQWTFQVEVLEYRRDYFRANGTRVRRESLKHFLALPAGAHNGSWCRWPR